MTIEESGNGSGRTWKPHLRLADGDAGAMNTQRILQLPLCAPATRPSLFSHSTLRYASFATHPNASTQPSRWPRRLIYAGIFGTLGVGAGTWMDSKVAAPPDPGSIEDEAEIQQIQRAFEIGLPLVQELRKNPDYVETDVYENFAEEHRTRRLTSGPLAGSRGLGLQVSCLRISDRACGGGGHRLFDQQRPSSSSSGPRMIVRLTDFFSAEGFLER